MALLIGFAVASFAVAGLAIFLFRYRGTRARAAGLSAFALGLVAIAAFTLIHATVGPDHPVASIVFFVDVRPALRQVSTASFTPGRGGSIIPTRPRKVSSRSTSSASAARLAEMGAPPG